MSGLAPATHNENAILIILGQKVLLDSDLAVLYGVETKALVKAVKRNAERFPADFMSQLPRAGPRPRLPGEVSRRSPAGVRPGGPPLRGRRGPPRRAGGLPPVPRHAPGLRVVYAKPPFGGPAQVLAYLGRYTHRVAISNDRFVSVADGQVRFRWKDYAHANRVKTMTLPAEEFLRRFLLHVLPDGFVRIRHFGFLANRGRTAKLARCRALLAAGPSPGPAGPEPVATLLLRVTGVDITRCPVYRAGHLYLVAVFHPGHLPAPVLDTS